LIVLGVLQMRDQVVGRTRVLVLPALLGIYSAWSALATFGMQFQVVAAWAVGIGAMLSLARYVAWPRRVEFLADRNAFSIGGSFVPLFALLGVFAVRYVATVSLILNPQWRGHAAVAIVGGLVYGLLGGTFALRARTILAHAPGGLKLIPA
jgi:hypothetical protein